MVNDLKERFSMNISLTPEQEQLVQSKLQNGKYRSTEEVLEIALRLLDEYDRSEAEWVEAVRLKIDAAIEASRHTPPVDGETFVKGVLERFQQANLP
jgi:antitoxin ParD1/3/4